MLSKVVSRRSFNFVRQIPVFWNDFAAQRNFSVVCDPGKEPPKKDGDSKKGDSKKDAGKPVPSVGGMGPRSEKVNLKEALAEKIGPHRELVAKFRKEHANTVVDQVTLAQIYGGMRGIKSMVCDTSVLDANEGIRYRGYSIPEIRELLPKCKDEPIPEALFWLLMTGDIPSNDQTNFVFDEWHNRSKLPDYAIKMIHNFPCEVHPMAQLSAVMSTLSTESRLPKAIHDKTPRLKLWEVVYEDVMDLLAKLPSVAATIYRHTFKGDNMTPKPDENKDWARNLAQMMGVPEPEFVEAMRLYLCLHSDHEVGNVSAHTIHLVGSALSDCYLSYAAGINGLAGPLHGLANQESLLFINNIVKEVGMTPTDDQIKEFVQKTLKAGMVIPGFGHAVLRKTDPRYVAQHEFGKKYLPDDPIFKITAQLYKVVPPILESLGKVQNPWPNVDANSGVLLHHYGVKEMSFYPVLFGVSRALGTLAWYVWSRALVLPIERPKSYDTFHYMKMLEGKGKSEGKSEGKKEVKKC